MGVVPMSEVITGWASRPVHVAPSPEEAEYREFAEVHSRLADGWMSEEECENRIARLLRFNDHELPAAASLYAGRMVAAGWLVKHAGERRADGSRYRRVEKPPELLTPAQIIELREERAAQGQRERRERVAAANARAYKENLEQERRVEDQAFQECAARVLGPRFDELEAALAQLRSELREVTGR